MKSLLFSLCCLLSLSSAYADSHIDYCATPQAWAAQITVAALRNTDFAPYPLPKVEVLAQQKLSGTDTLASSNVMGELYSQTLLITVTSQHPDQASKRFIVTSVISDQECSLAQPIIIDYPMS